MKITFLALIVLCSAAAFGQGASVLSSQPQITESPSHPLHADVHDLATAQYLVGGGSQTYSYAQGERPLWEFGTVSQPTPLGDIARANRKEKQVAKKAEIVLEKQGS